MLGGEERCWELRLEGWEALKELEFYHMGNRVSLKFRNSACGERTVQMNSGEVFRRDLVQKTVKKNSSGDRWWGSEQWVWLEWSEPAREGAGVNNWIWWVTGSGGGGKEERVCKTSLIHSTSIYWVALHAPGIVLDVWVCVREESTKIFIIMEAMLEQR